MSQATLFDPPPPKSKKAQLLVWLQQEGPKKTHEVVAWGLDHYTVSAERYAQKLAQEGKLRRMTDLEKVVRYGNIKEDVWVATTT